MFWGFVGLKCKPSIIILMPWYLPNKPITVFITQVLYYRKRVQIQWRHKLFCIYGKFTSPRVSNLFFIRTNRDFLVYKIHVIYMVQIFLHCTKHEYLPNNNNILLLRFIRSRSAMQTTLGRSRRRLYRKRIRIILNLVPNPAVGVHHTV